MCGILAIFTKNRNPFPVKKYGTSQRRQSFREVAFQQSKMQRHRGPDFTGVEIFESDGVALIHERLAVIGVHTGNQPLKSNDSNVIMIANAEIYNYLELSDNMAKKRGCYIPKSDCNVIVEMYEEYGENLVDHITGMFAFALYDKNTQQIMIARDPIGIIPLYRGWDDEGNLWISSEMKTFRGFCTKVEVFPPGVYMFGKLDKLKEVRYFNPSWIENIPTRVTDLDILKEKLESAVRSHLQSDVDFGALLSGGVDSSLIASIATKIKREDQPNFRLKTFSVGLKDAPDFKYSRMVADYIDSDHTEIVFTVEQGLDSIVDMIHKLETYDVATVRCSIPMYLMSRYIKSKGIKMILSGEGADEIFGGYLFFYSAPDAEEFHKETVTKVLNLHVSDCLRANKSTMSWGLELRVPFLDTAFINYVMSLKPEEKIPGKLNQFVGLSNTPNIEKRILRSAFANGYLPDEVLWRQKEQLSDGVGYAWIDTLRNYVASHVSDEEFASVSERYPVNTPTTKEEFYYRIIFDEIFPDKAFSSTVEKWTPRRDWGCPEDPSGRVQTVHNGFFQLK